MKEEYYKINNPKLDAFKLFADAAEFESLANSPEVQSVVAKAQENYLSWQEFRNKSWATDKKEKIWSLIKLYRSFNKQKTIISDKDGSKFVFNPRSHVEFLHHIDLELGGNFMGIENFSEGDRRWFVRRNLIEESIASSLLEGANTSRKAAKKMLEEGRKPRDKGEQMIVNNHETMKWLEEDLKHEDLSLELLKEMHRKVTLNTIKSEHYGVLRETLDEAGNRLVIKPWDDATITYVAPDKEFVEREITKFIDFANDKDGEKTFIHPLIKAIMLHFWMGLLHPFEDGNGRLARIIFYWYMLRKGYWAFSYLSLSERIMNSQKEYSMAYVYSEQDENDLGYFIHYNISKLKLARKNFQDYIEDKVLENKKHVDLVKKGYSLNSRQTRLLHALFKEEQKFTTLKEYCAANDIGRVTATSDFKKLTSEEFLTKKRNGRNMFFYPTDKIKTLFR